MKGRQSSKYQSSEKMLLATQFYLKQQPVVFGKGWTHYSLLEIRGTITLSEGEGIDPAEPRWVFD